MFPTKKERLYLSDLLEDPVINYPSYYVLSRSMINNELLHDAIIALHRCDFDHYHHPKAPHELFGMFSSGMFPLYKERYIVGYFGGKMMFLESSGWRAMPCNEDVFQMEHWLVCWVEFLQSSEIWL